MTEKKDIMTPFRKIISGWYDEFDPLDVMHIQSQGCDCCTETSHYFSKKDKLDALNQLKRKLLQKIEDIDDWISKLENSDDSKHRTKEQIEEYGGWT